MDSEIYVSFSISSQTLTIEKIQDKTNFKFDEYERMGELLRPGITRLENSCVYNSKLKPEQSLEEHIENILKEIEPFSEEIFELSKEDVYVTLSCVIYYDARPPLNFSREIIKKIYELGASLDIDIYDN